MPHQQRTVHDDKCALRIYAKLDDCMAMVAKKLKLRLGKAVLSQSEWRK